MSSIACGKCGKEFEFKCLLNRHLNKKLSCLSVSDLDNPSVAKRICPRCNKVFSSVHNMNKHLNTICSINDEIPSKDEIIDSLKGEIDMLKEKLKDRQLSGTDRLDQNLLPC